MSKEIDFTKPLSEKDRDYLAARGRYSDIERSDNAHNTLSELGEGDGTGTFQVPIVSSERAAQRREELLRELAAIEAAGVPSDEDDEDEDEDDVLPYESWKSAELNDEIDRRNEGREVKISKAGSVADRAERLYADDNAAQG